VAVSGASAAWVGDAFYVVVGIRPQTGGDAALRLITVRPDGTFSVVADVGVGSLTGTPRIAAGAGDLRVTYSGGAAGTGPYPVGVVWQRLALSGAPAGGSTAVAGYPAYLGEAPAIALGDDTVVLVPGSGHDELGVVVVDLDGKLVTPLLNVAKAPAIQVNVYDMVRRGSDLVVGWLSPLTGAVSLARVTP